MVYSAVKTTVVIFTDPSLDIIQRRICFFGANPGSVESGQTSHVPAMSVAGLCARFAPMIKWHRIAL